MRARTLLTVGTLSTLLVAAHPAAAEDPQIQDPRGDVAAPSLDILSAVFSRTTDRRVSVKLRLAAPPDASLPASYSISFSYPGCQVMTLEAQWDGAAVGAGRLNATRCSGETPLGALDAAEVPVRLRATSIEWTLPLGAYGYRVGTVWRAPIAATAPSVHPPIDNVAAVSIDAPYGDSTAPGRDYKVGA